MVDVGNCITSGAAQQLKWDAADKVANAHCGEIGRRSKALAIARGSKEPDGFGNIVPLIEAEDVLAAIAAMQPPAGGDDE